MSEATRFVLTSGHDDGLAESKTWTRRKQKWLPIMASIGLSASPARMHCSVHQSSTMLLKLTHPLTLKRNQSNSLRSI